MGRDGSIKLGKIAERAIEILMSHPSGLSMAQLREILGETHETQEHFNRRIREIRKAYELSKHSFEGASIYRLGPPKKQVDAGQVSEKLRAAVLHAAHGRCQMCGRTISEDGIKLQADHKIPQSWGDLLP